MTGRGEKDIKENVGKMEGRIRTLSGLILFGISFFRLTGLMYFIVGIIGLYLLVTGTFRVCLIYKVLGINTKRFI